MKRIAIIGTGVMGNHHAETYAAIEGASVTACCDAAEERGRQFAKRWKIPRFYSDYRRLLDEEELDGVSVVVPDAMHAEISIAALERGIPVLCEKPMASTLEEAGKMLEAARASRAMAMVNYSKRNSYGLQAARDYIASGGIGTIKHVEASYLQGWLGTKVWGDWRTDSWLTWRLSTKHGSLGALGDLGCHIYDMATFLCGDITELYCRLETFDKGVPGGRVGEYELDANDSFVSTVTFAQGAIGTIHSTRWAVAFPDRPFVRVYGELGTIQVDLNRSSEHYSFCPAEGGTWQEVKGERTENNHERFLRAIETGVNDESDFENAYKIQTYLECSVRSSEERSPVKVEDLSPTGG